MKSQGQMCLVVAASIVMAMVLQPLASYARTQGYVITGDGSVATLDTDTDVIVERRTVPDLSLADGRRSYIYLSGPDSLLLTSYAESVDQHTGAGEWRIAAYDLKTLIAKKKDLGVVSLYQPTLLLPPQGPVFFVRWFDPKAADGRGADRVTRFTKATLSLQDDLQAPDVQDCNQFSTDGKRIYSTECASIVRILILDSDDLHLLSLVDARTFLAPGRWGGSVHDIQNDRMLLIENLKSQDLAPNRYTFFTRSLTDGSQSTRIVTGTQGEGHLTPVGDTIVLLETTTVRNPGGGIVDVPSVGRLHVYDVATGAKLGQVTFPVRGGERLQGIRPQGDKLYLASAAARREEMTITVISLTTFQVLKDFVVPNGGLWLFETSP